MTLQQANKQLLFQLFHIYDERESANIADLVMEKITEWKRIDRIVNKEFILSSKQETLLLDYIQELSSQKPVQYVLHEAWFFGMKLYVNEHVLIPRPETEELINWVLEDLQKTGFESKSPGAGEGQSIAKGEGIKILDIGTGSGCIALGLKKKLPLANVYACDVSEPALEVAQKNAFENETAISFFRCDFLDKQATAALPKVTIIVSNPPYIPLQDKTGMHPNVLLYEPHLALFVEDHNPLVFYEAIADFAKTHAAGTGRVFIEIHEQMGLCVSNLFIQKGFDSVEIRKDLQGKDRMIRASLSLTQQL